MGPEPGLFLLVWLIMPFDMRFLERAEYRRATSILLDRQVEGPRSGWGRFCLIDVARFVAATQ